MKKIKHLHREGAKFFGGHRGVGVLKRQTSNRGAEQKKALDKIVSGTYNKNTGYCLT